MTGSSIAPRSEPLGKQKETREIKNWERQLFISCRYALKGSPIKAYRQEIKSCRSQFLISRVSFCFPRGSLRGAILEPVISAFDSESVAWRDDSFSQLIERCTGG